MYRTILLYPLMCLFLCYTVLGSPVIHFSDLITGPDTGLGDGLGSGVIVTVWGQNLGSSQGSSKLYFNDSSGQLFEPHIYYWKNADGQLPGGPANLWESHRMQEIAFSIPDSAQGAGTISVQVDSEISNELNFTVRSGNIYHIKSTGSDTTGDGSFANPWLTVAHADGVATAGDTLYMYDVVTGGGSTQHAIYNNRGFLADTSNQMAYIAYPDTRPSVVGTRGLTVYLTSGIVTSKLDYYVSNCNATAGNCNGGTEGIQPSAWGRVIGNAITDQPNGCANAQSGAISGGNNFVEGSKIFGNYIYEYSCPEATKFHHTTYFTIRSGHRATKDIQIEAWEIGWNYLKNNHAKNGIHNYDEDNSGNNLCGDLTTDLLIHNNVVVNQAGAGITMVSSCGWSQDTHIYNNLILSSGGPSDIHCTFNCGTNGAGIQIGDGGGGYSGDVFVHNNLIQNWNPQVFPQAGTSSACFAVSGGDSDEVDIFVNDNICYNDNDRHFVGNFIGAGNKLDNFVGSNNVWYYSGSSPTNAIVPTWDTNAITSNPLLTISGSQVTTIDRSSAIKDQSSTTLKRDIYGTKRGSFPDIGPVEIPPQTCAVTADCDDGLFCNGQETCVGNICQVGTPLVFNDSIACTVDSCVEPGTSNFQTSNALCDDGDALTIDICSPTQDCTYLQKIEEEHSVVEDTLIGKSSTGQGDSPRLDLRIGAYIKFDLSNVTYNDNKTLEKAALRIYSTGQFGALNLYTFVANKPWVQGGSAPSNYGVTRTHYNLASNLAWDNDLGDWEDKNGVANGLAYFDHTLLIDDNTAQFVDVDLTNMFKAWTKGSVSLNNGVFLNPFSTNDLNTRLSTGAPMHQFHTLEYSDANLHPRLVLTFVDRSGQNATRVKQGDINKDGVVDMVDLRLLARYVLKRKFGSCVDCDQDSDGKPTIFDLIRLLRNFD